MRCDWGELLQVVGCHLLRDPPRLIFIAPNAPVVAGARDGRPISLPVLTGDQILTDLDQHVMQAAALGMYRDGVVRHVAHDVRHVGADEKTLFRIWRANQLGRRPPSI